MVNKILKISKLLTFSIFSIIFIIFVFNNTNSTSISLWPLFVDVEIKTFLLIIFVFILGMLFSMFLNLFKSNLFYIKTKENSKIKNLEKELKILKNDINNENKKNESKNIK